MNNNYIFTAPQPASVASEIPNPYPQPTEQPTRSPLSNTGVNPVPLRFGLGWLTFTFRTPPDSVPSAYAAHLSRQYQKLSHDFYERTATGLNFYEKSIRYRSGAFLAWSDDREDLCLSLTQKSLDRLTPKVLARLIYRFNSLKGSTVSRLDIFYDDFSHTINTDVVECALRAGQFPSKAIQWKIVRGFIKNDVEGDTIYIGSNQSDFYVRVYNKFLESNGKQNCTRLEFQLRAEVADSVFKNLIYSNYEEWPQRALELLLDRFDFVYRSGPRNDRTKKRLEWWQRIVGNLQRVQWRIQAVKSKLLSTLAWAETVLPTTLHMICAVFGVDRLAEWAAELLKAGAFKLTPRHLGMIEEFREEMSL